MSSPSAKKYRRDEEVQSEDSVSDEEYQPYIPVKERKRQQLAKLGRISQVCLTLIFVMI